MGYAMAGGKKHLVRVVQDLGENWALEVYPEPDPKRVKNFEPFKPWPCPIVIKLRADSSAHALEAGLETLKKRGEIDDYHLDDSERPPPPPPPAAPAAPAPAKPPEKS